MKKLSYLAAAGLLLLSTVPAMAQGHGNNQSSACTQTTSGAGGAITEGDNDNENRGDSRAALVGVIDALIQNVSVLSNIDAKLNALNSSNLQVVCLNDVLNQNDIRVLQDVLNGSPILSGNLNQSLNNNNVLNNLLKGANIALLNNVQVVAVNLGSGQVFVLRQI